MNNTCDPHSWSSIVRWTKAPGGVHPSEAQPGCFWPSMLPMLPGAEPVDRTGWTRRRPSLEKRDGCVGQVRRTHNAGTSLRAC